MRLLVGWVMSFLRLTFLSWLQVVKFHAGMHASKQRTHSLNTISWSYHLCLELIAFLVVGIVLKSLFAGKATMVDAEFG